MDNSKLIEYGEINLSTLINIMWKGKRRIFVATLISALFGVFFGFSNTKYRVTTRINPGKDHYFVKYQIVNDIFFTKSEANSEVQKKSDSDEIDRKTLLNKDNINSSVIFKSFVNEFNDYQEIMEVLNEKVKNKSNITNRKLLADKAKNFSLNSDEKENYTISYVWENVEEGEEIIDKAILLVLENVRNNLNYYVQSNLDLWNLKKSVEKERIKSDKAIVIGRERSGVKKQISFLKQELAKAENLGIVKNRFDPEYYKVPAGYGYMDFYLRGPKALKEEIRRLESLTDKQLLYKTDVYTDIARREESLKSDLRKDELLKLFNLFEDDSYKKWVNYDFDLAKISSLKNPFYIIITFTIIGLLITTLSLIISYQLKQNNNK